jgi:hypothetical protein
VEHLAREILGEPIRVKVGQVGSANKDTKQVVNVLPSDAAEKMPWLLEKMPGMIDDGDILLFAAKKYSVDEFENQLNQRGFKLATLHSDKDQTSWIETQQKFKSGTYLVPVAVDVAARLHVCCKLRRPHPNRQFGDCEEPLSLCLLSRPACALDAAAGGAGTEDAALEYG